MAAINAAIFFGDYMTKEEFLKRLVQPELSKRITESKTPIKHRRGVNAVTIQKENFNEKFTDIFDYEDDDLLIKKSSDLFLEQTGTKKE